MKRQSEPPTSEPPTPELAAIFAPRFPRSRRRPFPPPPRKKRTGKLQRIVLGILSSFFATTILTGLLVAAVGGGWLGYQLIVDPDSLAWLNQFLPETNPIYSPDNPVRTLAEIQALLRSQDFIPGEPIPLVDDPQSPQYPERLLLSVAADRSPATARVRR